MFYDIFVLLVVLELEIVLGMDNLIFISLLVQKMPNTLRNKICFFGLSLALLMRLAALFFVSFMLNMDKTTFSFLQFNMSMKDCALMMGGAFLSIKSTLELYNDIFAKSSDKASNINQKSKLVLIVVTDLVFSMDSMLTAMAMTHNIMIITIAFMFSMLAVFFLSSYTVSLVNSYPELKMLGTLFMFMIGIYLIFDGLHIEMSQKYMHFAFAFSILTTFLNIVKSKTL